MYGSYRVCSHQYASLAEDESPKPFPAVSAPPEKSEKALRQGPHLTACDMPNMDEKFIRFLILKLDKNFDGIVCLSEKGKILPMNGIYRNSLKENLREELIKDNRKFIRFIEDNNFKFLKYEDWKKFDEKNIFENLNTIKELEEFKKKLLTIKKD